MVSPMYVMTGMYARFLKGHLNNITCAIYHRILQHIVAQYCRIGHSTLTNNTETYDTPVGR